MNDSGAEAAVNSPGPSRKCPYCGVEENIANRVQQAARECAEIADKKASEWHSSMGDAAWIIARDIRRKFKLPRNV